MFHRGNTPCGFVLIKNVNGMLSGVRMKPADEVLASPIVQQTAFWSEVKKNLGVGTGAYAFKLPKSDVAGCSGQSGSQEADVLVVQQQLDAQHSIAYVPYGPEIEPVDGMHGPFLEELSESLRAYLPSSCIALRYDLCWESFWSGEEDFYDERGQWQGPPDAPVQEMRFNFGTQNWGFKKAQSNLLPSNTVFLNLLQSEAALLAGMKSKTRYNIRLAARKGVVVDELGMDQLDLWYALYSETARRNGIYLHELEYFRAVLEARKSRNAQPHGGDSAPGPAGRTAAGGYVSGGEWQQGDVFVWGICYRKQSADGQLCPAVGCRAEGKTHGLYRIRYVWCGAECRSGASHVWFISF